MVAGHYAGDRTCDTFRSFVASHSAHEIRLYLNTSSPGPTLYRRMHRLSLLLVTLLLFAVGSGCKSTQKRYEKATQLEAQARWAEAARYYIEVLEREPDFEDARQRLGEVGALAIDGYLAAADAALAEGQP